MLQWETPLAELAIYVVPRSPADLSPQGVLVVVSEGCCSARFPPLPAVRADRPPWARSAPAAALYLPAEARFDPDAADAEVTELLGSNENVYLWHPACGLIGFEPGDRRRVADLLEAPPERKAAWDVAMPGVSFSRRLTAIEPDRTPSAESVLGEGQEDIGSRSSALGELPRSPGEPPASPLARMAAAVKQQLTKLLHGPGQKPEEPADKEQSPEDAAGQAAGESTGAEDEPPGATSRGSDLGGTREWAKGRPTLTRNRPRRKNVPVASAELSAGLLGATAGMARAARQALAGLMQRLAQLGQWLRNKMQPPGRGRAGPRESRPAKMRSSWKNATGKRSA